MKRVSVVSIVCALLLSTTFAFAADEKKAAAKTTKKKGLDLSKAKCPITGKAVKKGHAVGKKGQQVFFCCPGCVKSYKKNAKKYSTKAHHQLVLTKQSVTSKCALTGKPCKSTLTSKIDGVAVYFCCPGCKSKVDKAKGDAKMALVFADAPFKRGFKVAGKSKKKKGLLSNLKLGKKKDN